jgi:ANTAR domain
LSTVTSPSSSATIDAALRAAAGLTGMELVFLSGMTPTTFTFLRVHRNGAGAEHATVQEGVSMPRADSFCARMLAGAPARVVDVAEVPEYADSPFRAAADARSYIGVPVVTAGSGVIGTLCAIDSRALDQSEDALVVLRALADVIAGVSDRSPSVRVRRTAAGWQVEPVDGVPEQVEDLTIGMALADLLTPELVPPSRPPRPSEQLDETAQLRTQVMQLQHALAARVVVEQAIGVLAERLSVTPREALERLRRLSRSRGQKVHDLARLVVESVAERGSSSLPRELR